MEALAAGDYLRHFQPLLHAVDAQNEVLSRLRNGSHAADDANARTGHGAGLTARGLTVLALLANGLTTRAIAHRLMISPHTVTKHQQNLYRKLGTNDRLKAVLTAQSREFYLSKPPICMRRWAICDIEPGNNVAA